MFLANKKFFDGLTWHRVVKDFVIQGGEPKGTGSGGPGYEFEDELPQGTNVYRPGVQVGPGIEASEKKKFLDRLAEAVKDTQPSRREALEDLFWAVLTSKEFVFNR